MTKILRFIKTGRMDSKYGKFFVQRFRVDSVYLELVFYRTETMVVRVVKYNNHSRKVKRVWRKFGWEY